MVCKLIIVVMYIMLFFRLSAFVIMAEGIVKAFQCTCFNLMSTSKIGNKISIYLSMYLSTSNPDLFSLPFSSSLPLLQLHLSSLSCSSADGACVTARQPLASTCWKISTPANESRAASGGRGYLTPIPPPPAASKPLSVT